MFRQRLPAAGPPLFGKMLTALLSILLLTACREDSPKLAALPPDAVLLAFGDSITYGTGALPQESYPAVLEGLIGRKVINAGVPGEVTAEGLARLSGTLDSYPASVMILCLGGNDIIRKLDQGQLADNLRGMVRMAVERGIAVVLVGVPQLGLNPEPPQLYRQIAREYGIPYEGKVLKDILSNNALKADYIHPNAQGYRKMAEALAALLAKSGAL